MARRESLSLDCRQDVKLEAELVVFVFRTNLNLVRPKEFAEDTLSVILGDLGKLRSEAPSQVQICDVESPVHIPCDVDLSARSCKVELLPDHFQDLVSAVERFITQTKPFHAAGDPNFSLRVGA